MMAKVALKYRLCRKTRRDECDSIAEAVCLAFWLEDAGAVADEVVSPRGEVILDSKALRQKLDAYRPSLPTRRRPLPAPPRDMGVPIGQSGLL